MPLLNYWWNSLSTYYFTN